MHTHARTHTCMHAHTHTHSELVDITIYSPCGQQRGPNSRVHTQTVQTHHSQTHTKMTDTDTRTHPPNTQTCIRLSRCRGALWQCNHADSKSSLWLPLATALQLPSISTPCDVRWKPAEVVMPLPLSVRQLRGLSQHRHNVNPVVGEVLLVRQQSNYRVSGTTVMEGLSP